jgi:hypothetical protein
MITKEQLLERLDDIKYILEDPDNRGGLQHAIDFVNILVDDVDTGIPSVVNIGGA